MTAVFLLFSSSLIRFFWPRFRPEIHWICPVLSLALPFSAGGFHTATSAVLSLFLTVALLEQIRKKKTFSLWINSISISVMLLFSFYCITPFWAADRGMALFALPRYLPLVLFVILLMQTDHIGQHILDLIPFSGCLMVTISSLAVLFPELHAHVTVNGRLAGFFQYPNTFAAFLLVGLIIQSLQPSHKFAFLISLLLAAGIVLSGSKTVFVLMILFMGIIILTKHEKKLTLFLSAALLCGLAAGFLANTMGLLSNADRFTDISASSGSFLVRLLYFRDVIPYILSHPFGIGYMGYPAIEGTIQTGRYYVSFIHNGFLQLLLEIGWLPSLLVFLSLIIPVFSAKTNTMHRYILLAVLFHCMLDFDLQFSSVWMILLSCLQISRGKQFFILHRNAAAFLFSALTVIGLWLGCGDWLYRIGKPELCLTLTPFHTDSLAYQMTVNTDPYQIDQLADQILAYNNTHSLAYSAKANVAFSRGDILSTIQHKEKAIQHARYTTAEYCDYFQKLYAAMQLYLQSGDVSSAAFCRDKLLQIPRMMEAVSRNTHFLAGLTGDDSSLFLPPEYSELLMQLQ